MIIRTNSWPRNTTWTFLSITPAQFDGWAGKRAYSSSKAEEIPLVSTGLLQRSRNLFIPCDNAVAFVGLGAGSHKAVLKILCLDLESS